MDGEVQGGSEKWMNEMEAPGVAAAVVAAENWDTKEKRGRINQPVIGKTVGGFSPSPPLPPSPSSHVFQ